MTNEILAFAQDATVEDALTYLRQNSVHLEMVYYLYIKDEEEHLMGVVSLRQLVTANPATPMRDLMDQDVIKVQVDTDQEEVARIISKYDLLGVPVVDADNRLVGMITVDDVIDVIREEQAEDFSEIAGTDVEESEEEEHFSWRTALRRFSWLAVNVVAGFILALVISRVFNSILYTNATLASLAPIGVGSRVALNAVICLIPMLLRTSGSTGSQALGIAGWHLREKSGRDFWRGLFSELRIGTIGGVLSSILVALLAWLLFHSWLLSLSLAIGFALTLLVAALDIELLQNVRDIGGTQLGQLVLAHIELHLRHHADRARRRACTGQRELTRRAARSHNLNRLYIIPGNCALRELHGRDTAQRIHRWLHAQTTQKAAKADIDSQQAGNMLDLHQLQIVHLHHAKTLRIHDLLIQNVAAQQQFIGLRRIGRNLRLIDAQPDRVFFYILHL
jgi:hypothetical protein